jgi:predicted hydrocarbon binding protein
MADKPLVTTPEWKGAIYLNMWREIEERYGRETAKEICGKVMFEAGRMIGKLVADRSGGAGVLGLEKAWENMYGISSDSALELNDERYVFENNSCAALELWKQLGLSADEIREMGDGYCATDCAFAEGFDPDLRCTQEVRLMKGDAYCRWLHFVEK